MESIFFAIASMVMGVIVTVILIYAIVRDESAGRDLASGLERGVDWDEELDRLQRAQPRPGSSRSGRRRRRFL